MNHNFTLEKRKEYLLKYGSHSMAFSSMQPEVQYFDVDDIGFITYRKYKNFIFVLSNPICDSKNFEIIIALFLQQFPKAFFIQMSKKIAHILHKNHSFYSTCCGLEPTIDLQNWNLQGRRKNIIRTALNQAKKQNILIQEGEFIQESHRISKSWLKTRRCSKREIKFLIRPMHMEYNKDVRYFYAYKNNEPIGYIFFDPIYQNKKIISYAPNISRSSSLFKQGIWYALMSHAINQFKNEGIESIHLGIMPISRANKIGKTESILTRFIVQNLYQYGGKFYNFKGLQFAKSRFDGETNEVYYCHKNPLPLFSIFAMSCLAGFI